MCEKCLEEPWRRHTRYCDDWWDDSPHGGYKADRALKDSWREREEEEEDNTGMNGWWYGRNIYE